MKIDFCNKKSDFLSKKLTYKHTLKFIQESFICIIVFLYNQLYDNQFMFEYSSWKVILR